MKDIYPSTGRTYDMEAVTQVVSSGEFDPETLGEDWSLTDFGIAVVKKYKELLDETL